LNVNEPNNKSKIINHERSPAENIAARARGKPTSGNYNQRARAFRESCKNTSRECPAGAGRGADSGTVLLKTTREVMNTYDRRRLNCQIVKAVQTGYRLRYRYGDI